MANYQILVGIFGVEPPTSYIIKKLRSKNFTITALWDKQLSKASATSKQYKIPHYSDDYNEIIMRKDVDLIIVFSASHFAIPISTRAVSIGKHVICNNCAGIDKEEMDKMVDAGLYYPQLLSLPFNPLRFNEAFISLRDHIEDIGKLSYIRITVNCHTFSQQYDWRSEAFMGGGVLNMYGSNIVDIVGFITNENIPLRVWGSLLWQEGLHCDSMTSFEMVLDSGVHVFVTISAFISTKHNYVEFIVAGSEGFFVIRDLSLYRSLYGEKSEVLLVTSGGNYFQTGDEEDCSEIFKIGFSNLVNSLHGMFIYNNDQKKMTYQTVNKLATFTDMGIASAVLNAVRTSDSTKHMEYVNY